MAQVRGARRSGAPRRWGAALAAAFALVAPRAARAQSTKLTISPSVLSFATPTVTDYTNKYVCAGSITASLTVVSGGNRNDALLIRLGQSTAIVSTPTGFTKALADYQYSTNSDPTCATGTWTSVPASSGTGATVHASARVPYSQIIYFRLKLDWAADRGGVTYVLPSVSVYVNNP